MRQKGKRTKGIEQAHPFEGMSKVNPHAAGVQKRSWFVWRPMRPLNW